MELIYYECGTLKHTKNQDLRVLQENYLIVCVWNTSYGEGYMGHYMRGYIDQVDHVSYQDEYNTVFHKGLSAFQLCSPY